MSSGILSFRIIYAAVTAFLIAFVLAPGSSGSCRRSSLASKSATTDPSHHLAKSGTPTMGGLLIIFAVVLSTLLWADITKPYVWLVLCPPPSGSGAIGICGRLHEVC